MRRNAPSAFSSSPCAPYTRTTCVHRRAASPATAPLSSAATHASPSCRASASRGSSGCGAAVSMLSSTTRLRRDATASSPGEGCRASMPPAAASAPPPPCTARALPSPPFSASSSAATRPASPPRDAFDGIEYERRSSVSRRRFSRLRAFLLRGARVGWPQAPRRHAGVIAPTLQQGARVEGGNGEHKWKREAGRATGGRAMKKEAQHGCSARGWCVCVPCSQQVKLKSLRWGTCRTRHVGDGDPATSSSVERLSPPCPPR